MCGGNVELITAIISLFEMVISLCISFSSIKIHFVFLKQSNTNCINDKLNNIW